MTTMNGDFDAYRGYGFFLGLAAGACVGAGLALCFAPRSGVDLRKGIADSARKFGNRATDKYQQAATRVGDAIDGLTETGQSVRENVADAVARGAQEVERMANVAKGRRA